MDLNLKGKRAWVLGASQGIGFSIADHFAQVGAEVVLSSRSIEKLETAKEKILRGAPEAHVDCVPVDTLSSLQLKTALEQILKKGPVDILVCNTGGPPAGPILDISLEQWDAGYQSLLRSVLHTMQGVIPRMKQKKWGRIAVITSTSAKEIIPMLPVSGTFRAGLTSLVKSMAKEVGRDGILVNNILPGPINTDRLSELATKSPEFHRGMAERSALGRIAEPRELAILATFLCSDLNTYVTGTDIVADGGSSVSL